jgi:hypothetical protein
MANFRLNLSNAWPVAGRPPVVMVNDDFYEGVTTRKADEMMQSCK